VNRGDVYRYRPTKGAGHEQRGDRFAVVLQADELLPRWVVIVAPTSRSAQPASIRPEVKVGTVKTTVLVEHMRSIDANRLGRRAGHLTTEEMWTIDEALITVLGLD
jgi:mRNA interferase MazF